MDFNPNKPQTRGAYRDRAATDELQNAFPPSNSNYAGDNIIKFNNEELDVASVQ